MSSKVRPYCSTCKGYYRGIYPIHASGATHLAKLHRGGRLHRGDLARSLGVGRLDVARMLRGDTGSDRDKVRAYKRRRPLDGPRFSVKVGRYWRRRAWHATRY